MGAVLGIRLALSSIVIGSFIALPYATYYIIKKQDREIPFGPFLILAVLICFMFMNPINNFINMLFLIS
jgi:prepilin signal peptidase PulO-like enzyme (type II secretory pathway)